MTEHPKGVSARYDIAKHVVASHQYYASGGPIVADLETEGGELRRTSEPSPTDPYQGALLDATTAGAIVAVCEAMRVDTLAKVDAMPLPRFIDFVWKHVRRETA